MHTQSQVSYDWFPFFRSSASTDHGLYPSRYTMLWTLLIKKKRPTMYWAIPDNHMKTVPKALIIEMLHLILTCCENMNLRMSTSPSFLRSYIRSDGCKNKITITHKKSAGDGIRTQELLRDQALNLAPLTGLGYPRFCAITKRLSI